jgi:hypothetical protein
MAEFLMVYHGGSMPETVDKIAHELSRWGDWMNSLGGQLNELGAPVGKSKTLSASGIKDDCETNRSAAIRLSKPRALRKRLN